MKNVLTALQPSGMLHIGNLFGAIEPMVSLQEKNKLTMFIVDYHAITVPQDPKELRKNILFSLAAYLAAGIDPTKTLLFQQSQVSAHTELAWIFNCNAYMGELERMTQFKDKAKGKGESVSVGLFDYPVLMAADILLYDTDIVPVGDDQKQHLELTRDIAERFNNKYGKTFTVPEPMIRRTGARVMGLDDPTKKMSKSASSPKSYISLMDEDDVIIKKIKSAKTDSENLVVYDEKRPGISNLITLYHLVTKMEIDEIEQEYQGKGYGDFKSDLAEAMIVFLKPLRSAISAHLKDKAILIDILEQGALEARAKCEEKMAKIRKKIGVSL